METALLKKICEMLNLGALTEEPKRLSGGFLHEMVSVFTDKGKYAVKFLNPFIMQRETAMENFRTAERFEAVLEKAGLPILPALTINGKKMQEIDRDCRKYAYEESLFAANFYGIKRQREIMPRAFFGEPQLCDFEGMKICGVEDPEHYLTQLFGDWRQLPPVEQQVTHHDFVSCDLEHSYLE